MSRWISHIAFFLSGVLVISRIWVAEDAYITFRVVENLFYGAGLVYNPGENIEAYSHPLWMMLLVVIRTAGVPLHMGSILLGGGLVIFALGFLIYSKNPGNDFTFPAAVLLLTAISGFRDFSTGGMEFSLVFFLLCVFFISLSKYSLKEHPAFFSSLLALLYLTRPELGLLLPWYSIFFIKEVYDENIKEKIKVKSALLKFIQWIYPVLLWAGGYHLFRFYYFNDFFPNTYYAKSGLSTYYSQGFKYLLYTLIWSPGFIFLTLFPFLFLAAKKWKLFTITTDTRTIIRDTGAAYLLAFYIIRLGGDFMSFRFLLPEAAILALAFHNFMIKDDKNLSAFLKKKIELIIPFIKKYPNLYSPLLVLILFLFSFWPVPASKGFVGDERNHYMKDMENTSLLSLLTSQSHPWGRSGKNYEELQECLQYNDFWITNSQSQAKCMQGVGLGYFGVNAGPGVKILDEQALPNREVALMPVRLRFRPGHEHFLNLSDVIHKGVLFCSSGEPAYDRIMKTRAGILIRLDPALLETVPDIQSRLKRLIELKKQKSNIIPRLESRYNVKIEDLYLQSSRWEKNSFLKQKNQCWENFKGNDEGFFY